MSEDANNQSHESTGERVVERHQGPAQQGKKPLEPSDVPGGAAPEDVQSDTGAEGGSSSPNHGAPTPFHPTDDDSALGDTDQHSKA